jgi:3-oxoacyl-[acyl-carrier protein] reductase
MDLGIAGKSAIVCGGSSGLGKAIASALSHEGVKVLIIARDEQKLSACAGEIGTSSGTAVDYLSVDLSKPVERERLTDRCANTDILVNNSGGPPVGDYKALTRDDWLSAIESNMLCAIELITASLPGMTERQFGRILNVTSHMVKAPVAMLSLSNGARAGLTGYVGGIARDIAGHNITINNLLPGQFETDRLRSNHEKFAGNMNVSVEEFQQKSKRNIPAGRFGRPEEFGDYAAFLCGVNSGYVTGQNIMLDGGQYPGLF